MQQKPEDHFSGTPAFVMSSSHILNLIFQHTLDFISQFLVMAAQNVPAP